MKELKYRHCLTRIVSDILPNCLLSLTNFYETLSFDQLTIGTFWETFIEIGQEIRIVDNLCGQSHSLTEQSSAMCSLVSDMDRFTAAEYATGF